MEATDKKQKKSVVKDQKRLRVVAAPTLMSCVDQANAAGVTDKEFLDVSQMQNGVAIVYYR